MLQLILVVVKVAATRTDHAHHPCILFVGIVGCSADNAGRRRGATDGEVVTQLNAPRTGLDGRWHSLKVLGTKLVQHRWTPKDNRRFPTGIVTHPHEVAVE